MRRISIRSAVAVLANAGSLFFLLSGSLFARQASSPGTQPTTSAQVTVYEDPCSPASLSDAKINYSISQATCSSSSDLTPKTTPTNSVVVNAARVNTISGGLSGASFAYAAYPQNTPSTLLLFMPGTNGPPKGYTQFLQRAAYHGYAAIGVQYTNSIAAGNACGTRSSSSPCYELFRADAVYGTCTSDALGREQSALLAWDDIQLATPGQCNSSIANGAYVPVSPVAPQNSVVGAAVAALQYFVSAPPSGTTAAYWSQFLAATPPGGTNRYTGDDTGLSLAWSKVILAGHSQGGGNAAYLATHLPAGSLVPRVIVLSAPEDNTCAGAAGVSSVPCPAAWMSTMENLSGIPVGRFWGLRSGYGTTAPAGSHEGINGAQAENNWSEFNSVGFFGVDNILDNGRCFASATAIPAGAKVCARNASQRLVITLPSNATNTSYAHGSTAVDPVNGSSNLDPDVAYAWDVMLNPATLP